jgi:hypothetical protein
VTESRRQFPIRKGNKSDEFSSILWSEVQNNYLSYSMLRKLRQEDMADAIDLPWKGHILIDRLPAGFDPKDRFSKEIELGVKVHNLGMADLKVLGYNYRFGVMGGDEKHYVEGKCFSDPKWLAQIDDAFAKDAQVFGPFGPIGWTHGDETFLSEDPDVCWSPSCLKNFRKFCKSEYGDITSLNASWSSHWESWNEIMPTTYDEARESGNYPVGYIYYSSTS